MPPGREGASRRRLAPVGRFPPSHPPSLQHPQQCPGSFSSRGQELPDESPASPKNIWDAPPKNHPRVPARRSSSSSMSARDTTLSASTRVQGFDESAAGDRGCCWSESCRPLRLCEQQPLADAGSPSVPPRHPDLLSKIPAPYPFEDASAPPTTGAAAHAPRRPQ